MFEMDIELLGSNVQKACNSIKTIDDVYEQLSIEGHLEIIQNNQIVFSEDVAAVEFYWYISKWVSVGSINKKLEFRYTTIEHIEPILFFSYYHDKLWKISSPWIKSVTDIIVEEHVLESQVNKLIRCLEKDPEF